VRKKAFASILVQIWFYLSACHACTGYLAHLFKIANSTFAIYPFPLSGYSNSIEKKLERSTRRCREMAPSYEKNRRLLVEHAQGNHAVDVP
jgi:hypothetical protein